NAVEQLALDVISETAAKEFLLERTQGKRKPSPTDEADAFALAQVLGRLPLALEQAGAFIAKHRGSLQEYSSRWKQQEAKVLQWHDQRSMKYPASVATTWQTSFDQLSNDGRGLLNVLCWLAPDPIPLTMIQRLTAVGDESPIDIESGIADLAEYSLLKWTSAQNDAVEVHRLVQEITQFRLPELRKLHWLKRTFQRLLFSITRCRLPESESKSWLQRALRMANDFVPLEPTCDDVRSWPTIYIPAESHLAVLIQSADTQGLVKPFTRLMSCLACYLYSIAGYAEAEPLMRRALAIDEQSYGTEHPNVSIRLNSLAQLLQKTNRLSEAEPLMRRALAINEQSYGTEHPRVALHLNNLAQLLDASNRLSEAEPLMRRALAIDEQSYGTEHPRVAIDLNNLATLLRDTNRLSDAEPMMLRALTIFEKSYGTNHPNIAAALNNLAQLLQRTNRVSEAEPLMRRALAIVEQSYGIEHPDVATALNSLASLLKDTNRLSEAEPLSWRHVAIFIAFGDSTGHEHPHMQTALDNYFSLLQAMGYSEDEAIAKMQSKVKGEAE
ncbi:MAG: tetratricopeptide repeat protein, partial [Pirellula sp.]